MKDMTKGNPTRLILQFAIPLLIGTEYVFDTIYNPPETALMKLAPRSVKTRNGLLMLVLQAAYAQTIWFGTQFDSADLTRILRLLSGDMAKKRLHDVYGKQNIVLCGFMGSGKTTIGRKLARAIGLNVAETGFADFCENIRDFFALALF